MDPWTSDLNDGHNIQVWFGLGCKPLDWGIPPPCSGPPHPQGPEGPGLPLDPGSLLSLRSELCSKGGDQGSLEKRYKRTKNQAT